MEKNERVQTDTDWENRTLCSDESCIGVIGPDGRCKECGLHFEGELKSTGLSEKESFESMDSEADHGLLDEESTDQTDPDWENRTLCRDESCIGVVGPDNKCKECGLIYKKE